MLSIVRSSPLFDVKGDAVIKSLNLVQPLGPSTVPQFLYPMLGLKECRTVQINLISGMCTVLNMQIDVKLGERGRRSITFSVGRNLHI